MLKRVGSVMAAFLYLADLLVTAHIRVRSAGGVGVPLRFSKAVLREVPVGLGHQPLPPANRWRLPGVGAQVDGGTISTEAGAQKRRVARGRSS